MSSDSVVAPTEENNVKQDMPIKEEDIPKSGNKSEGKRLEVIRPFERLVTVCVPSAEIFLTTAAAEALMAIPNSVFQEWDGQMYGLDLRPSDVRDGFSLNWKRTSDNFSQDARGDAWRLLKKPRSESSS